MKFKPPYLHTECVIKTSRSGGKGGQNVNKLSTKVQLDFSIPNSILLKDSEKQLLLEKLKNKLTNDGVLQVVAQEDRTQLGNKEIAFKKFYKMINACFVKQKKRIATAPTAGAKAKKEQEKKRLSNLKQSRKAVSKNQVD